MDNVTMLIVAGAGVLTLAAFALVYGLMALTVPEEDPVRDRLRALKAGEQIDKKKDQQMIFETLVKLVEPMTQKLYSKNITYQGQMKTLLTEAGRADNDAAVWRFLAVQLATGLVIGVFGFVALFMLLAKGIGVSPALFMGLMALFGGILIGRYIPVLNLRLVAAKRKAEIRYTLPDTLDLMVVCVEAGLGLDSTIQRVGDEAERMAPDIAHELKRVTKELNAGISRSEAFANLGARAGVDELRSLCNMIVQSDKLGTSIAEALRIYADDVRVRRRQKAEELAAKASIKMTFPLVLFVFPPLFIVLMGPMVIQALGTFFGG